MLMINNKYYVLSKLSTYIQNEMGYFHSTTQVN